MKKAKGKVMGLAEKGFWLGVGKAMLSGEGKNCA